MLVEVLLIGLATSGKGNCWAGWLAYTPPPAVTVPEMVEEAPKLPLTVKPPLTFTLPLTKTLPLMVSLLAPPTVKSWAPGQLTKTTSAPGITPEAAAAVAAMVKLVKPK